MVQHKRSRSRSKVRIPIRKTKSGMLRKYGYDLHKSAEKRKASLRRASRQYGALSVFRKLNALATLSKNRSPKNSRVYLRDRQYVKAKLLG